MRQLVIDDLSPQERDNLEHYLKRTLGAGPIEGLFWLRLPDDLLGEPQQGHDSCGPFHFGIELGRAHLSFELLIRNQANLHCSCIAYATKGQRDFLLRYVDEMLAEERIHA
jgi:hypothetical protein